METKIVEQHGLKFRVYAERDLDMGAPWDVHDGHGPVSGWTSRDKYPGEVELNRDGSLRRYYDFAEATRIAKRDGWGLSEPVMLDLAERLGRVPTRKEVVREAVMRDFQRLQDWCEDRWTWVAVIVSLLDVQGHTVVTQSLCGIESDSGDYFAEVEQELIAGILHGRGDPDKLERLTVGPITYELRAGAPTLADKLAAALRAVVPYAEVEASSLSYSAAKDDDEVTAREAEKAEAALEAVVQVLAEYDATKAGAP